MTISYAPFDIDGRLRVDPIPCDHQTRAPQAPTPVTAAQAKRLIDAFVKDGYSVHSASGATLWVVIAWCQHQGKQFKIVEQFVEQAHAGFYVTLMTGPGGAT